MLSAKFIVEMRAKPLNTQQLENILKLFLNLCLCTLFDPWWRHRCILILTGYTTISLIKQKSRERPERRSEITFDAHWPFHLGVKRTEAQPDKILTSHKKKTSCLGSDRGITALIWLKRCWAGPLGKLIFKVKPIPALSPVVEVNHHDF